MAESLDGKALSPSDGMKVSARFEVKGALDSILLVGLRLIVQGQVPSKFESMTQYFDQMVHTLHPPTAGCE